VTSAGPLAAPDEDHTMNSPVKRSTRAVVRGARRLAAGVGAASAVLLLAACGPEASPPPPPPQVSVATVVAKDVADWDEFTGRLEAVQHVEIRPRVTGYIDRVAFEEGSEVRKGDLLFVIDPRPYQAELAKATAALARARTGAEYAATELQRAEGLLAERAISREEYEQRVSASRQAGASVQGAAADVAAARLNLSFTQITSPIDGRVGRAEATPGNLVQSGQNATLLTTVVSLDPIYVEFQGDEQVYLKYTEMSQRGERPSSRDARNPVLLGLASEDGYPHQGYMVFVDNQLNPATGTIRARAIFDNKDRKFTPGLFARVRLIGSGKYHALLVNDRAVGTDQDKKFVLVLGAGDLIAYRPVTIGRIVDGLRVVLSGLEPGETIVVNGLQRVQPGMKVAPTRIAMDEGVPAYEHLPDLGPAKVTSPTARRRSGT
jgi:multidrug efflux system membrane fusion protein